MAQNIALSTLYLTDFDMLASMSFLLQFIALNSDDLTARKLKILAGSVSDSRVEPSPFFTQQEWRLFGF